MGGYFPYIPARCSLAKITFASLFWFFFGILLFIMLVIVLVLSLVLGLAGKSRADNIDLTVDLGYSKYQGVNEPGGVSHWWGIRYAAPPVGNLRFRAPQDPVVNTTLQQANTHGPVCHSSPSTSLDPKHSEDCLFLDVYAPTSSTTAQPVFVWFQGGGFNSLADPNRNGSKLIEAGDHGMVVVTFNYRVGVHGFLASKEVEEDGDLNVGLKDQRKVLEWIQKYIHLFGGDPKHVTIGGASAGGASVDLHLSAYGGRDDGLFHAAAAESQSFGAQLNVSESQYQYDALIKRVGCDSHNEPLDCLRDLDIKTLMENNQNIPTPGGAGGIPNFMYSNVIDEDFTPDYTYTLFAQGKFVKVPSIFGDDTNEGTVFTPKSIANYTQMNAYLTNNFVKLTPAQLSQIDILYPKAEQFPGAGPYWRTAANAYGEMRYNCPGIFVSTSITQHGAPSYNYHWDHLSNDGSVKKIAMGVQHTAESGYIWGDANTAMTPVIQAYWTSFIRTKDPNTYKLASAPSWGTFDAVGMLRIHFPDDVSQVAMESVPVDQRTRCAFLSGIGGELGQ